MGKKACIIGSGNWGSAIARIVGATVQQHPDVFDHEVPIWVFEEEVNGRKLSEIINTDHENVKYLPGRKLPANVIAVPDLVQAVHDADILIFVVPHQFVDKICSSIVGKLKSGAFGVSLIKGIEVILPKKGDQGFAEDGGEIKLISDVIKEVLGINIAVLMGANLANEIADENFSEATVGCKDAGEGAILKQLFQVDYFRITCVTDAATVELCGALKNIVACGAGFSDGLGFGDNTKAAIIRLGLMEMTKFIEIFYPGSQLSTFFESCGVADLITTCYGGRNRRCSEEFVKSGKPIKQIEEEMLNGQKLQGPDTAAHVFHMLQRRQMEAQFPLFTAIHHICTGKLKPTELTQCLLNHPEHM